MKPHETLLDDGILVQFEDEMGRAAFVSHQWISAWNPDPNLSQLRHLKGALMKITTSSKACIDPDILTELSGHAYQPGMSVYEFRSKPLFIWYDYFSIPQIRADTWTLGDIKKPIDDAIASMPAYIARSHFFLVLCPLVESPDQIELFGSSTWASRGWCRVEKTFRQLLPQRSYVVIKSADHFEMINDPATSYVVAGCPGEGTFGFKEDKEKIGKTLGIFLKHLVLHYLQKEDFVAYRTYLNLQAFYLRGFSTGCGDEMFHLVPGSSELSHLSPTTDSFLYQNGFKKIREYDRSGWSPLCYAALRGDPEILQSLLKDKANPDEQTKKTNHLIGLAPALSVLALSSFFGHKECVQVLISARANLAAGYNPPLLAAAMGNQPECIRMLCSAGDSPYRTAFGSCNPLLLASMVASTEAVVELLSLMGPMRSLSRALHVAMWYRGGTVELVQQLVEARADVNEQVRWPKTEVLGAAWAFQGIQYRFGIHRLATRLAYHSFDATPLMFAIISGQHEGAAALLVAKADGCTLRNSRKKTALDLAQEMSVPQFLMDALEGDLSTCNRIVASALTNRYPVSISF